MSSVVAHLQDRRRLRDGATAGLAAGVAFALVMLLDMRLSGRKVNDFRLLGDAGPFRRYWRVTGPSIHFVNSLNLGLVYAAVEPLLRGPGWLRGLTFALAENTILWPVVLLLDRVHPAIRDGELEPFNGCYPFLIENLRHAAYGLTLGALYDRLARRRRSH